MKNLICLTVVMAAFGFVVADVSGNEILSMDRQRAIIENYMYVTGQRSDLPTLAIDDEDHKHFPGKCGTPAILEFQRYRDQLDDGLLKSYNPMATARPLMDYYYDSPGGRIKLHYNKTGDHACYQSNIDSDGDGVPNYIESLGLIADHCYDEIFGTFGYPTPVVDTACPGGGDDRVDIYLRALTLGYYGLTYNQSEDCAGSDPTYRRAPCWIVIDHDFQHLPAYVGIPLEAAKVTLAHEIFHAAHFAMDATEPIEWFEMTAVWMEEQIYDHINDFYLLDEYFFNLPRRSLQLVNGAHEYASVIWPKYLSYNYGTDIIKDIWLLAADIGPGWHYLQMTDSAIFVASGGEDSLVTAMSEFALWNYFTGPYADLAPNDIGYPEKAELAFIPHDSMDVQREFPLTVTADANWFKPEVNASTYIHLTDLDRLQTQYWECTAWSVDGLDSTCTDSVLVVDDTLLTMWVYTGTISSGVWGISVVGQLVSEPDSLVVLGTAYVPGIISTYYVDLLFGEIDFRKYQSITFIFTATSINPAAYHAGETKNIAYVIYDNSGEIPESWKNRRAAVLTPYPNPAVVSELADAEIKFRFQVPTDSIGFTVDALAGAFITVDLYTVAGEYVALVEGSYLGEDRLGNSRVGVYEAGWDMKNQTGRDVASGVYLAYARLFTDVEREVLLAESHQKVVIIR
ncbi:MAG: hypothetical protein DRP45_07800 [Candidatus Zixiibacteriota bacterium]|nr:MAG: hypothetical protein DRP45_07800 [candidate division Zixibacteria bacterium]